MVHAIAPLMALLALLGGSRNDTFEPARLESGDLFVQSPMALGGGEVLLELDVDATGSVREITVLRSTPPFSDQLRDAASRWRFAPARDTLEESEERTPVDSKVLVAGVFRPPTTYDAPARGEAVQDLAKPSAEVPFPGQLVAPAYPPTAYWHIGETVLLEAEVGVDGKVAALRVMRSAAGLDAASTEAVQKWRFRPARREGDAVRSYVYVVFGFREPVTSGTIGRPAPE